MVNEKLTDVRLLSAKSSALLTWTHVRRGARDAILADVRLDDEMKRMECSRRTRVKWYEKKYRTVTIRIALGGIVHYS